jgi:hypothetical protein
MNIVYYMLEWVQIYFEVKTNGHYGIYGHEQE